MRVGSGLSRCRYLHIKLRGFSEYVKRGTITLNFPRGQTVLVCLANGSVSASTSANSSKSWQLMLCFLLLACDFYIYIKKIIKKMSSLVSNLLLGHSYQLLSNCISSRSKPRHPRDGSKNSAGLFSKR